MRIAIVAGEASGDQLGAELIEAIRRLRPDARFEGVAGPAMRAAGCEALGMAESLSVMGLVEVLGHLPSLLRLRGTLIRRLIAHPPQVFVGIDSPDFNVGLERRLRDAGIATVQYVSPQFWAWRPGRVKHIARAADLVLCLLPFEQAFYDRQHVAARYVGHPLADRIPDRSPKGAARRALDMPEDGEVVALLPGSRASEVKRLGGDFAGCARWLAERRPALRFVAPMANAAVRALFEADVARAGAAVTLVDGRAQETIAAADAVLVASGTATLQTLLIKRPMVVAYRVAPLTRWIMQGLGLLMIDRYAMPNLLAGRDVVQEIMQDAVTPEALGTALLRELDTPGRESELVQIFDRIHHELRRGASEQAARAVVELATRAAGGAMTLFLTAGVDEAGRGPLAGPVYAAAVVFEPCYRMRGLRDSKQLTRLERERLAERIQRKALAWAVAWSDVAEIDQVNILQATLLAMRRALDRLPVCPAHVQVDGCSLPAVAGASAEAIIDGDCKVAAISAASILAKVYRDAEMRRWHGLYPEYRFDLHKGYATRTHLAALVRMGPCPIHRQTFAPVRECLEWPHGPPVTMSLLPDEADL